MSSGSDRNSPPAPPGEPRPSSPRSAPSPADDSTRRDRSPDDRSPDDRKPAIAAPPSSLAALNFNPQDTETLFQAYLETASDMVYTVDLEGRLTFINDYGRNLLKCYQGEWYQRPYMSFVSPESQEATAAAFARLLETGELKDYEFMIQPLEGESVCMEVNGRVLYRQGEPIGGLGIARDITERKRAQQRLQMFLRAIESSYDSVAIVELDGTIVYANSATARTFGCDVTEIVGQHASLFYPEDTELTVEASIDRALAEAGNGDEAGRDSAGELPGWSGEATCQRQNGEQFPAIVSVSPVPGDPSSRRCSPTMVSISCRDISSQKAIQAELAAKNLELEQASRHKSAFLASMSHELRTPLTSILGFSSLLLQGLFGDLSAKQRDYVRGIEDSGTHLLNLIKDILDLSKVEAGRIDLAIAPCSLVAICQDAIGLVSSQTREKRIAVELSISPDLDTIAVDELRFRQMLVNLLSNALKFSEPGSRIGIDAQPNDGTISICVWDRGIGIAEADMNLLFRPFQQLDTSLSRTHEGTGLGLALTQRLAKLHGGSVTCESQLGEGSRFTIVLPDSRPPETIAALEARPATVAPRRSDRGNAPILIVEDNEANATFLCDALESWGYRIRHETCSYDALAWMQRQTPGLILMDINLPDINGLELTQTLRRDPRWADLPIVAMTALTMQGDRERCLEAGMQDYISKPIDSRRLAALVHGYLSAALRPREVDR